METIQRILDLGGKVFGNWIIAAVLVLLLVYVLKKFWDARTRMALARAQTAQALSSGIENLGGLALLGVIAIALFIGSNKSDGTNGFTASANKGKVTFHLESNDVPKAEQDTKTKLVSAADSTTKTMTEEELDAYYMAKETSRLKDLQLPFTSIPEADSGSFFGKDGTLERAEESVQDFLGLDGNFHQVKKN